MAIYQGKILTNSPFFISEAVNSGATSTIELRVWNGDFNTEPTAATYTLNKQALSVSGTNVTFEITQLINDSFEHIATPYILTGSTRSDALWVNIKSYGGDANRDDTFLALNGYSEFTDGINYQPTNIVLIRERILYHYDNIPLRIPVYCDGTANANFLTFKKGASEVFTGTLVSFINSDNSYDKVQYVSYSGSTPGDLDTLLIRNNAGTTLETIIIKPVDCTKYTPYVVSFINKFGVNQELTFDLKSKESINIRKDKYNTQTLVYTNGLPTYDTGKHAYKVSTSTVRDSITLNTNYIDESFNDVIGDLISSEAVWINSIPVNVTTNSLDYKTGLNDSLIQYTINFEYAFDKRNNIY